MSALDLVNINFRLLRVAKGLRQCDLAERTGIPQPRLSAIERRVVRPSDGEKHALLRAMELTAEDASRIAAASRIARAVRGDSGAVEKQGSKR
jgi:transcriptional regulator with XRE-family HTH domain